MKPFKFHTFIRMLMILFIGFEPIFMVYSRFSPRENFHQSNLLHHFLINDASSCSLHFNMLSYLFKSKICGLRNLTSSFFFSIIFSSCVDIKRFEKQKPKNIYFPHSLSQSKAKIKHFIIMATSTFVCLIKTKIKLKAYHLKVKI